jgi:hypothetical protein
MLTINPLVLGFDVGTQKRKTASRRRLQLEKQ